MHTTSRTVQQVLARKSHRLFFTEPDATVYDALVLMAEHDIGSLVVLDGERLAGIFSERDYARQVVLLGKSSRETRVREIMTHKVLCVRPEHTVSECMGLMTTKRVRHLPVLDHKKVIGVISIGDVVKEVITEQQLMIEQLEQYIHS
ncbi:MAG: CBS domain-containing protein [Gammaproteobacteria bacterium]